ncbi:helix-turn-helix domain-containing protein [Patescibacteria group bacterium]|nr:helix-turn-helix domain-containing protein [Patescibacteria group bacterium]
MTEKLLNIREAAKLLGVSVDTLRRWDKSGKLVAIRKAGGTHRYYTVRDLDMFSSDLIKLVNEWALSAGVISPEFYCSNSAVFQARLMKMQEEMLVAGTGQGLVSLVGAVAGEIGNNSYDHNLGNWPDVPGVFFGYDIHKGVIVLADRGLGILKTLSRVRPSLVTHEEALRVAFTEMISGRAPEKRGNGLKFVRQVIAKNPISLSFQTGDAEVQIAKDSGDVNTTKVKEAMQGCFAIIRF